jgi:hypothetical protein
MATMPDNYVKREYAEALAKENERLTEEIEKLREAFGLSQQIDYERFKAGLSYLGPINKPVKQQAALITAGEILDHIRDRITL